MHASRSVWVFLVVVTAAAATPAAADWLVLRDGSRIETKGPWQVKGNLVVFTLKTGSLSALKASEVDLDQSAVATSQARAAAAQAGKTDQPKKKPVLVLTDKDVAHVTDSEAPEKPAEAKQGDKAPKQEPGLTVQGWEQASLGNADGTQVFGALRNDGRDTATNISVVVKVYDNDGQLLGTADAVVSSGALPPGQATNFRAAFPGIVAFKDARFEVKSRGLVTTPATPEKTPPSTR